MIACDAANARQQSNHQEVWWSEAFSGLMCVVALLP